VQEQDKGKKSPLMIKIALVILACLIGLFNVTYSYADTEIKKQYYPDGKIWQEIFFKGF
jgi:hypothetical protein